MGPGFFRPLFFIRGEMMKILVAGYGNPFRQDDRVGHELTPMIAEFLKSEGAEVQEWMDQQILPEIVEEMRDKDLAIFVDASADNPGEEFSIQDIVPSPELEGLNIHSMGPAWVLDLMQKLKIPYPRTLLVSVSGESFDFSEEMTPLCQSRVLKALEGFREWWSAKQTQPDR